MKKGQKLTRAQSERVTKVEILNQSGGSYGRLCSPNNVLPDVLSSIRRKHTYMYVFGAYYLTNVHVHVHVFTADC